MKKEIAKIIIGLLALAPLSVGAFFPFDIRSSPTATETTIVNEVNVSASTGGNVSSGGKIKEGEAKSNVKVYTEINGKVLENFEKEFSGDTNFEQKFEYATRTASTTTNIRVRTNNQQPTTTIATSTMVAARHFNEWISDWISKLFKNVFSLFKK